MAMFVSLFWPSTNVTQLNYYIIPKNDTSMQRNDTNVRADLICIILEGSDYLLKVLHQLDLRFAWFYLRLKNNKYKEVQFSRPITGLTSRAAFSTDLESDAASSWSKWSWRCSRCRRSSSLCSPASELWPPLFPAPSWSALWYPAWVPAPPGPTPPPLWWTLHRLARPAPEWKTL